MQWGLNMAIWGKKKAEEPIQTITLPPKKEEVEDVSVEEIKAMQQSLLMREEVKIYLAAEEGKKLFDLAMKLNKEQK